MWYNTTNTLQKHLRSCPGSAPRLGLYHEQWAWHYCAKRAIIWHVVALRTRRTADDARPSTRGRRRSTLSRWRAAVEQAYLQKGPRLMHVSKKVWSICMLFTICQYRWLLTVAYFRPMWLEIPICVPVNRKSDIFTPLYLSNQNGSQHKLIGFGHGAPPQAQTPSSNPMSFCCEPFYFIQ